MVRDSLKSDFFFFFGSLFFNFVSGENEHKRVPRRGSESITGKGNRERSSGVLGRSRSSHCFSVFQSRGDRP